MRRILLWANLLLVAAGTLGTIVVAFFGFAFAGRAVWPAIGGAILGLAALVLSVAELRGSPRWLPWIAVCSLPFYCFVALELRDDYIEASSARRFLAGDSTASADAAIVLGNLGSRTGPRRASKILVAGIPKLTDLRQRATGLELLGKLVSDDPDAKTLLAREYFDNRGPDGVAEIRRAAFAALRQVDPYGVDPGPSRLVRLEDAGVLTFALAKTHWLFGDTVTVFLAGFVLPRKASADSCERAAAERTPIALAAVLAPSATANLQDLQLREDGELIAGWAGLDQAHYDLLLAALPPMDFRDRGRSVDWCRQPPRLAPTRDGIAR